VLLSIINTLPPKSKEELLTLQKKARPKYCISQLGTLHSREGQDRLQFALCTQACQLAGCPVHKRDSQCSYDIRIRLKPVLEYVGQAAWHGQDAFRP